MKRKFDQLEEEGEPSFSSPSSSPSSTSAISPPCSSTSVSPVWDSDEEVPWIQKPQPEQDLCNPKSFTPLSILKRTSPRPCPGRVAFGSVTVFYFPRCQGFTSVPSRGGCTLGMAPRHRAMHRFSLAGFTRRQERLRREKLRQRLEEEKLEAERQKLAAAGLAEEDSNPCPMVDSVDDASLEEELRSAVAQGRLEEIVLQPQPARQRRALLRAAGVRRIDREEKRELKILRQSREDCGCHCDETCDPDTCSCSLAGIRCQMDHTSFPCGCTKEGCANPTGRVEFNQARVQTHFVHTLARLQVEQAGDLRDTSDPGCDHSCSGSDTTDSSTTLSSSSSSSLGEPQKPRPSPSFNPWDEEEEEEEASSLDQLSYFHVSDVFGAGSLVHWTQSYFAGSNLTPGILDENANLDAGGFGGDAHPYGGSTPSSVDPAPSPMDQLGSDSLGLLQTLPDYSLGPRYASPEMANGPASGDLSPGFLESLLGFSEPATETTSLFSDSQNAELVPV